jgi:hypothetical protein
LVTSAEGALGPAGSASAEAVVEEVALAIVGAVTILEADVVSATCTASLSGVTGSTTLAGAEVLGTALDASPAPNTALAVGPVAGVGSASVTLNRQVENADGSLSVTALAVELDIDILDGVTITGSLEISTATCGVAEGVEIPVVPSPAQPVPAAPAFTG